MESKSGKVPRTMPNRLLRFLVSTALLFIASVAIYSEASAQLYSGPSRYDLLRKEGDVREITYFTFNPFGSVRVWQDRGPVSVSVVKPSLSVGIEQVVSKNSVHPWVIGYSHQVDHAISFIDGSGFTDIYFRGYLSTVWGAQIGRKTGGASNGSTFSIFADLFPNGEKTRWRAMVGAGVLTGSGANAGIGYAKVSYQLDQNSFITVSANTMIERIVYSFGTYDQSFTRTFLGFTKRI